ncbi:hypothetical protein [Streptomyces sp. NPDC018059]|uniref:hypothetical protein n=1 Tax=Streptomyces sp. NPDC018059 TaxID=3365041 RepID=UPI0037BB5EC0
MTITDIDLYALPADTLVVENGEITPVGELVIAKMARDLAEICRQSDDPQAVLQMIRGIIPKLMTQIVSRRDGNEPSPLRTVLTNLVGSECLHRRPGRDPLTGDRIDGKPDPDDSFEFMPCTEPHGHTATRPQQQPS